MKQQSSKRRTLLVDTNKSLGAGVIAVHPLDVEALGLLIKSVELFVARQDDVQ